MNPIMRNGRLSANMGGGEKKKDMKYRSKAKKERKKDAEAFQGVGVLLILDADLEAIHTIGGSHPLIHTKPWIEIQI